MNPSTTGWIKKYYSDKQSYLIFTEHDSPALIKRIREIGFSYGVIDLDTLPPIYKSFDYTQEELSKICFLQILEAIYIHHTTNASTDDFLESISSFYGLIEPPKSTLLTFLFKDKDLYSKLERVLTTRWKEHFFSQSKNNDFVLNMLLFFIDALSYEAHLSKHTKPMMYDTSLIDELIDIIVSFKQEKEEQNNQDICLILFLKKLTNQDTIAVENTDPSLLETSFVLDFLICNSWNNTTKKLTIPDLTSVEFERIQSNAELVQCSVDSFMLFIAKQKYDYAFFRTTNLFENIVKNSTNYIEFLLTRNKIRLVKELQKNTQLMKLLVDSTYRDLNTDEKKMVKKQTLEVLKTIPSLAIFLLPGGTIVLPIILKFIPSLLPSSFNENTDATN